MQDSDEHPAVVRDNTGILLAILLVVFVAMIMLAVLLVRMGDISHKLDVLTQPRLLPQPGLSRLADGGLNRLAGGNVFFRV